jgi:hypothetical protein
MDCTENTVTTRCPPKGRYANCLLVGYNAFEFVFDFGQVYSGEAQSSSRTRIVTSPGYAKAMTTALQSALDAFEQEFGHIGGGGDAAEDTNGSRSK